MRYNLLYKNLATVLIIPLIALIFGGCSDKSSGECSSVTSSKPAVGAPAVTSESTSEMLSAAEESKPSGEPMFLVGLDGKAILTSEITRLENTDKTADTLTKDDLKAKVHCEGFAYYKTSLGVGYNSFSNPELFEGYDFVGEVPKNTNEWKRANVGDEICGLKVKSAQTHFYIRDEEKIKSPEDYLSAYDSRIEFEGTVEAEGILQVINRSVMYPETNEMMIFYPTKITLPFTPTASYGNTEKGFERPFDVCTVYNHPSGILSYSEINEVTLGFLSDVVCDMDGIGTGDIAYVRVKLGNIKVGADIEAELESVQKLDFITHDADEAEAHQPAPVL